MEYTDQLERIYADWQRQVNEQAFQQALLIGYEARFGAMPEDLRAALGRVHDESALRELIAILTSRAHEDIVAALQQAAGPA